MGAPIAALGYRPIPVMPNSKSPGSLNMGVWKEMSAWNEWRDRAPTLTNLLHWGLWEDANVGVILGNEVTPGWEVGALDFDTDDPDEVERIESSIPPSTVTKRGQRGFTAFYLLPAGTKGRRFRRGSETVFEILTGNGTRQTVIPPSIHPGTKKPYEWLTAATLATVPAADLVRLTEDDIEKLINTVQSIAGVAERAEHTPYVGGVDEEGSPHNKLNTAALRDLPAWVPQLGLPKLTTTSSGFKAIPPWRSNRKGWSDEQRSQSLGFSANGIRDFSADKPHSPLDVVMLTNGWDLDDAFLWLAGKLGRIVEDNGEWAEAQVASKPANGNGEGVSDSKPAFADEPLPDHDPETGEVHDEEPATVEEVPPAPVDLTRVPGLLGELVDYIAASSRRPNRPLALGSAVVVLATLMGQRICGPTRAPTHQYFVALAKSGAGKEHPRAQIGELLRAAGREDRIAAEDFMSQSAVYGCLARMPVCAAAVDEFGAFLKRIGHVRASGHEQAVTKTLRSIWGVQFKTHQSPEYAGKKSVAIYAPALSIYGVTTPSDFFQSLKGDDVVNGFLNRFLLIEGQSGIPDRDPELDGEEVPQRLAERLRAFYDTANPPEPRKTAARNLAEIPARPSLRQLGWADEAARAEGESLKAAVAEFTTEDNPAEPFYARTYEMALRLATVRAAGQGLAEVTAEDMRWGRDFAMASAAGMFAMAEDFISGSEHEANCLSVLRYMKDRKGASVTLRDVSRRLSTLKGRDVDEVIKSLCVQELIIERSPTPKPGAKGRPSTAKVYNLAKAA